MPKKRSTILRRFSIWAGVPSCAVFVLFFMAAWIWGRMSGETMPILCFSGALLFALFAIAFLLYVFYDRMTTVFFRVGGFCLLFVLGSLLYFLVPVNQAGPVEQGGKGRALAGESTKASFYGLTADSSRNELCRRGFESVNRTVSAFFRSHGGLEVPTGSTRVHLCYGAFQILVVLYLAGLVFSYLGRDLSNALHVILSRRGRTLAIWGYSHKAEFLVKNLTAGDKVRDVVFQLPLSDEYVDGRKSMLVHEISRLTSDHCRVRCHWHFVDYDEMQADDIVADRNFFISESGRFNIALAQKAMDAVSERSRDGMVYYVRVETSADEKYFSTWIDDLAGGKRTGGVPVDVRILKESDMIAESLVTQCPVEMRMPPNAVPGVKSEKPFSVLFVGFGKNGRSALNKTIENSQCSWRDFRATVVDKDLRSWQSFERMCKDAVREYRISFEQREFGTGAFSALLEQALSSCAYDRIVVCLGDDRQSLSFCSEAERIQREAFPNANACSTPIFVQMDEPYSAFEEKGDANAVVRSLKMATNIKIFGKLQDVYDFGGIDDDRLLTVARWLNYWYGEGCPNQKADDSKVMEKWKNADWFSKSSTRASALGQYNLLRMLGYKVESKGYLLKEEERLVDEKEFVNVVRSGRTLEILAECEHLRWNAFHLVRGIRKWDLQSPSLDEVYAALLAESGLKRDCQLLGCAHLKVLKGVKHNQILRMNAHAALVPFGDLPRTDAVFDNFLCGVMGQGDRQSEPADFQGEKMKRHCAVVDKVVYGFGLNCDAMQENDFKFIRTLYENVMNSGCVIVGPRKV